MTLTEAVKTCFRKYATFSGRASRSEYWKFWLFWLIVMIFLTILNSAIFGPTVEIYHQTHIARDGTQSIKEIRSSSYNGGLFGNVFMLAVLLPGIAAACRRMHDIGRSGWRLLLPFVVTLIAIPVLIIATIGWSNTIETLRTTGNVEVQTGPVGAIFIIAVLGVWLTLLFWLCKKSEPGPNIYGPNPHEVTP